MIEDEITITEEKVRLEIVADMVRDLIPGVMEGTDEGEGRAESVIAGLGALLMTAQQAANETLETFRRSSKNWRPLPMSLKRAIQDAERMRLVFQLVGALSVVAESASERVEWLKGNREREPDRPPGWASSLCAKIAEARKIADNRLRDEFRQYELNQ